MRTFEEIIDEILERIPDEYEKREGSVLYEAVAPLAVEIAQLEFKIENMSKEAFVGTATGEYLDELGRNSNTIRKSAFPVVVKATIIGGFPAIGTRFASVGIEDSIIYEIIKKIDATTYHLQAIETNPQANYYTGIITMIDFVNGIESSEINEIIIPQSEEETDEDYRKRIQDNAIGQAADGNVAQYYNWLSVIQGVGKSKVVPLWNGVNTVGIIILNELNKPASQELIDNVQNILDPKKEGLGNGKAPIGAVVTVSTVTEFNVDIMVKVVYKDGKTSAPKLKEQLDKFFSDIALDRTVVSYLQVGSVITNNEDIDYITDLTLNGGKIDIPVPTEKVAVLGGLYVN